MSAMATAEGVVSLHNLSTNRGAPKWSMQGRRGGDLASKANTPGPGSYSAGAPTVAKHTGPSFGFGTSRRSVVRKDTGPGPGSYGAQEISSQKHCSFGSAKRGGIYDRPGTPGPGSYEPNTGLTRPQSPQFSPGCRRDNVSLGGNANPGPGAYSGGARPNMPKQPAWGFGSGERQRASRPQSPGPGCYERSATPTGPQFSFGSRRSSIGGGGSLDGERSTRMHMVNYSQFT